MTYDAFISYSHAADGNLAPAVQSGLQRLAKPWFRPRALRIFRDETGLSTNPHLWSAIVTALDESEWFVLLASPESAASEWVDREIGHWLETKSAERILPAVTSGDWEWDATAGRLVGDAVPARLTDAITQEPRHLDLRWAHDETDLDLRNSGFRSAVADLAAPMHGVAKDELEGEDIRQHRRARRLARTGVITVVVLLVVAVVFGAFAVSQRNQAQDEQARANANATEALTRGLANQAEVLQRSRRLDQALLARRRLRRVRQADEHGGRGTSPRRVAPHVDRLSDPRGIPLGSERAHPIGSALRPTGRPSSPSRPTARCGSGTPRAVGRSRTSRLQLGSGLPDVAVSDAGLLAAGQATADGGRIRLWNLRTHSPWRWQPPPFPPTGFITFSTVALSNDGKLAVAHGYPISTLDVWDISTGRRIGAPTTLSGTAHHLAFSRDDTKLGVSIVHPDTRTLALALFDAATLTPGVEVEAHHGFYDPLVFPFADEVLFSADGRQVSSVASRGEVVTTVDTRATPSTESAISTFDTVTGARLPAPTVAVGQELVAANPDLSVVAAKALHDVGIVDVIDVRTASRLAELPVPGLDMNEPGTLSPTRPELVVQAGPGALAVADWSQLGAPHFVGQPADHRTAANAALSPAGVPIDLTTPLHALGLPTGCFAPIVSTCDYATDLLQNQTYGNHGIPLVASDPRRPWTATASASGQVAMLHGTEITIWNPATRHFVRRLVGVPAQCASGFYPQDLAFAGGAVHGRIVLGCAPTLVSWNLDRPGAMPAWTTKWAGPSFNAPAPVLIGPDGQIVAVTVLGGTQFLDARTGRLHAKSPLVTVDNQTGGAFSPDGRTYGLLHWSGGLDLIDPRTGTLQRTMVSTHGNLADFGIISAQNGPTSGNPSAIAFSPDRTLVAVWHDRIGLELWDERTGEPLAVLDGRMPAPTSGTGVIDADLHHRLDAIFMHGSDTIHVGDLRELVSVVAGLPSGDHAGVLRTVDWSLRPRDLVRAACTVADRDLTPVEWRTLVGATTPYRRTCTPFLTSESRS